MNKHYDIKHIELLKKSIDDNPKDKENREKVLSELCVLEKAGKKTLANNTLYFEIPKVYINNYLIKLKFYNNWDINNYFCHLLIKDLTKSYTTINNFKYETTSIDYLSKIDFDKMKIINEPFNKIIALKKIKAYHTILFESIFDNIDSLKSRHSSDSIKEAINIFNEVKNSRKVDWKSSNLRSLRIIEPLIKELFDRNGWCVKDYKFNKYSYKQLKGLLDDEKFRKTYSKELADGLIKILCDHTGFNFRNNEFHNFNKQSKNPIITKIAFICIMAILDLMCYKNCGYRNCNEKTFGKSNKKFCKIQCKRNELKYKQRDKKKFELNEKKEQSIN